MNKNLPSAERAAFSPLAWLPRRWRAAGLLLGLLQLLATAAMAQSRFVTHDDSNQVPTRTTKSGNVIINDENLDNVASTAFGVYLVTLPAHGSLSLNLDGSYTYTPVNGYFGSDTFTYQICQPRGGTNCSNVSTVFLNIYNPNLACTQGTGPNLLVNPSFTLGNTGFTSGYTYVPTPSSTPSLYVEGTYAITSNASLYHPAFVGTGRTGAGDNFMTVNGAAALQSVYAQTVTVLPNRFYTISAYATTCTPSSPAQLGLVVDGKSTSVITTLPTTSNQYVQLSDLYFSGPGPAAGWQVVVEIRDLNKSPGGNDFGIDDVYFGTCATNLTADALTTTAINAGSTAAAIQPLSATLNVGASIGVQVAYFTISTLPTTGTLLYNGVAVTLGQQIPVSSTGGLTSAPLTYTPASGCTSGSATFTYTATDNNGGLSINTATYTIPITAVAVTPGSIGTDQTLCAGSTPAPLTETAAASGGTGTYTYQWEASTDNITWTPITGATLATYAPGVLPVTTYFRRQAQSGTCATAYSNVVTLTVQPAVVPGTIGADQTICAGATPVALTSTAASGGTGTYTYQWESSPDNTTWTPISGATAATYAPGALSATTYFHLLVQSGVCAAVVTNVVTITVLPTVVAGSIAADQTICAGTAPAPLTSSGSTGSGTAYQWESSLDNLNWMAISGATAATYSPGNLSVTTYFRRQDQAGTCGTAPTNVVTITVQPAIVPGSIAADQTICAGTVPTALTSTAASGGSGTYAYQWESSTDQLTWTPVSGATAATYAPGALNVTTYFRRQVQAGVCAGAPTNVVTITVQPLIVPGSIGTDQTLCTGATPAPLTSLTAASGGTGTYAYQWESSTDNITWKAISGATTATYVPGALSVTTYFRRQVQAGVCAGAPTNVVTITVTPVLTTTVTLATPPAQCPGTAITFAPVVTNAGPTPTYNWLVNNVSVSTSPTFTSSTLANGDQVKVVVTPTAGFCSSGAATATVVISLTTAPAPTVSIVVQPALPVCAGTPLTFSIDQVSNAGTSPQYQWQLNGVAIAGATGTTYTSATLRDGQIITLVLKTVTSCSQPATATSNAVPVAISPLVVISAGPDKDVTEGGQVTLDGQANGTYPVTWTPSTGLTFVNNDFLHPIAAPLVTTTYTLSAGTGGCASSSQVTVTVVPRLRIPNAFSPNGDGNDDTWHIDHLSDYPNNHVTIFNRWGSKLFETTGYGPGNEWSGTIHGQSMPLGTYYYLITLPTGNAYTGSLTVVY
ncbi:MAG: gliding motility-associated C-terminal domain-containing protein [Janthinobacterium lividum]